MVHDVSSSGGHTPIPDIGQTSGLSLPAQKAVDAQIEGLKNKITPSTPLLIRESDSKVWDEAFQAWIRKNPGKTQEEFADQVLQDFWREYQATLGENEGSKEEFAESLFKEYGTELPYEIVKYAADIFLGDREHRPIGDGTRGTVVRGLEKEGREKIWIFSSNVQDGLLGEGGQNIVEKIRGISFVARSGTVTTKGVREYAAREAKAPPMSRLLVEGGEKKVKEEDPGNETLTLTHRAAREDSESGRKLPLGVKLDDKGRVVGLVKPFVKEIEDPRKAYMKLYKGGSFDSWIATFKPSSEKIIKAFGGAMHGFAAIVGYRLLHKDIKPANLFVDIQENREEAVKMSDFDGVFEHSKIPSDIDPDELLDLVKNFPITDKEGFSFPYNLYSDYELYSHVCNNTDQAIITLEEALDKFYAVPEEERNDEDFKKVEDAKQKLISFRNQQAIVIQQIQVFQMSLSLYESLAGPDVQIQRIAGIPSVFKCVLQPLSREEIAAMVRGLNLSSEQSKALEAFFNETIGKDTMKRADGKNTYKLFQQNQKNFYDECGRSHKPKVGKNLRKRFTR